MSIYEIKWKRTDRSIINSYSSVQKLTKTQSKLVFERLNQNHVGEYACFVYTSVSMVQKTFKLEYNGLGRFLLTVDDSNRNLKLKIEEKNEHLGFSSRFINIKNYDFECSTNSIWPTEWYKKINDSRLVLKSKEPFLRIDRSDKNNFGEYICLSSNSFGAAKIKLKIDFNEFEIEPSSHFRHFNSLKRLRKNQKGKRKKNNKRLKKNKKRRL